MSIVMDNMFAFDNFFWYSKSTLPIGSYLRILSNNILIFKLRKWKPDSFGWHSLLLSEINYYAHYKHIIILASIITTFHLPCLWTFPLFTALLLPSGYQIGCLSSHYMHFKYFSSLPWTICPPLLCSRRSSKISVLSILYNIRTAPHLSVTLYY
jgi:hypothetical protein